MNLLHTFFKGLDRRYRKTFPSSILQDSVENLSMAASYHEQGQIRRPVKKSESKNMIIFKECLKIAWVNLANLKAVVSGLFLKMINLHAFLSDNNHKYNETA